MLDSLGTLQRTHYCGDLRAAGAVVLFEQAESLAHNLAGRGVASGVNFDGNKLFELGRERDVYGRVTSCFQC